MRRIFENYLRKRALKPIVGGVPHILRDRYGASETYTSGQVSSSAKLTKMKLSLLPFAVAALCSENEFLKAYPDLDIEDRQVFRQELSRLFGIEEDQLNCRSLLAVFRNPVGLNANHQPGRHLFGLGDGGGAGGGGE